MENHLQTKDWGLGLEKEHLIIAGPCSAETPEQIEKVCQDMNSGKCGPRCVQGRDLEAKNQTREALKESGEDGLKWMEIVRHHLNIPITTEVGNTAHVESALKHGVGHPLDRSPDYGVNPFAVQEIAEAPERCRHTCDG